MGERQLLLRSTLTGSLTFIGSVIAVLVKYLSAWDECWGKGIESPSGSNVIDGIGVANPFQKYIFVIVLNINERHSLLCYSSEHK